MNRTRVFLVTVLSAAALFVVGTLAWRTISGEGGGSGLAATRPEIIRIRVVAAVPVEQWVSAAAEEFKADGRSTEGTTIEVEVIPMDGLVALGKWERNSFAALDREVLPGELHRDEHEALQDFPTVWIADGRYLVEIANASFRGQFGQDRFLSDGQYRVRPLAKTLLVWGLFRSRGVPLLENLGPISWSTVHKAAGAPTGWKELGGDPAWGNFKLAVSVSGGSVSGSAAIIAAAGEFFDKAEVTVEDVSDPNFAIWLTELLEAATDLSGGGTSTAESAAIFGYTAGDGGQFLESELLQNMEGIQTRWQEPIVLHYPSVTTWFDFPFAIWVGPETSALQKNAALAFQEFLLSEAQQQRALEFGLRPVDPGVAVDAGAGNLFERWQRLGVQKEVLAVEEMRPANRDVLSVLARWRDLNEGQ
ncbi:MAG: substrate-binding domain-containing protein [Caldilineaceae bacterium]|nr:substrate-binding domain-containing protein [Caldilineaceae bacterium]